MPLTAAAAHPLLRRERRAALVRALLLSAGGAAAGYAAYRLYRSDGLRSTARSLARLRWGRRQLPAALAGWGTPTGWSVNNALQRRRMADTPLRTSFPLCPLCAAPGRIIAENFLERWWEDLDATLTTDRHVDTQTIHKIMT